MEYEPVIGMEIHAELGTKTKVFCGCSTEFGASPNSQVCPICIGMPGVLPVMSRTVLEYALRIALALNCTVSETTMFDRKNYYYPDLPKNYQISQHYHNLGVDGFLIIEVEGEKRRIGIDNVHIEEDAGKLLHPGHSGANYSLVDLNRAGVPLVEIVTKPDIRSMQEAEVFMRTLRNLLQYLGVSECAMQKGQLRFEINISVKPKGSEELGTKVEMKNLNSIKSALAAINYETKRQSRALAGGERVVQETRLWDDARGASAPMRSKEYAHDYRYFPEPDLVVYEVSKELQEEVGGNLPELQEAKRERFVTRYGLPEYDANVLTQSKALADYFEECVTQHNNPKAISNWMMTEVLRELNEREIEPGEFIVTSAHLAELVRLIDEGTISGKIAKYVFAEMLREGSLPAAIVKEKGWVQITDTGALETAVEKVIEEHPGPVAEFKGGKEQVIGFLVGQVMKATRGKANPKLVNELLRKKLSS